MKLVRRIQVLLFCAWFSSIAICEGQVFAEKSGAETRVIRVPGNLHLREVVPLPPTKDGEPRFSLLRFLNDFGLEPDSNAEAIWLPESDVAVLTMSAEKLRQVETNLSASCFNLNSIQVTAGIWEYESDQSKLSEPPTRLKGLKELAGNSLRLLHSQVVLTRSGHRVVVVSRGGPSNRVEGGKKAVVHDLQEDTKARPALGRDFGSSIEFEPVVGPDGVSFDVRVEFEFRAASTVPGVNIDLSGATNVPIVQGNDVVVHTGQLRVDAAAANGKQRHYAFVIGGRILKDGDAEAATLKERFNQQTKAKEKEIIQRAREGLAVPARQNP